MMRLLVAAVVLTAGIVVGISVLFSGKDEEVWEVSTERFLESHKLVGAVPSDAAMVFCVKNFGRLRSHLGNPVADQLFSGKLGRVMTEAYSGKLLRSPAVLSSHFSEVLQPLLVVESPETVADSTGDLAKLLAAADSSGLFHRVEGGRILISPSETIISSSIRHYNEGHSVLETPGFAELAGKVVREDVLFLSNAYAGSIITANFSKELRKLGGFFKEQSSWTALSVGERSEKSLRMECLMQYSEEPSSFLNVLLNSGEAECRVPEILPAATISAVSLPIGDIQAYIKARRSHLDSKNKLGSYKDELSRQKKSTGLDAEEWAKSLGIKEVAIARCSFDGGLRRILLLRTEKKQPPTSEAVRDGIGGYARMLFGSLFSCESQSESATLGHWMAVCDSSTVNEYAGADFLRETLKERLSGNGFASHLPSKDCRLYAFHSLGESSGLTEATFSPAMAKSCKRLVEDSSFAPLSARASVRYGEIFLDLKADLGEIVKSKAPLSENDTSVEVPTGPFKVRNSFTKETCTLYQNSHLSICFQDGKGKDLWGVPFKEPILGHVREVDYFHNGKIQYLFAAGSKLYLIDRLGRFVNGFPVDLGKEIALGPEALDLDGAGEPTAIVLHKDNTIGMYSLQGKPRGSWKGIACGETIKKLPEPFEALGRKYWTIRTSVQTLVYPFEGGAPLVKGSGDKMIRPESLLSINEKGQVCAKCYDGKDRAFKLEEL